MGSKFFGFWVAILIGSSIAVGAMLLANYVEKQGESEIDHEKERLRQIITEIVKTEATRADALSKTVSAFYLGSEMVTDSEFAIFSDHIIHDDPIVANIAVFQNDKIIQSYPFKEFVGKDLYSIGNMAVYNKTYIILTYKEKESKTSTILFIDPTKIVPLEIILQEPFKVILYINNERFFAIENNEIETKTVGVSLSSEEQNLSVNVQTFFNSTGQEKHNNIVLEYLIFESRFANDAKDVKLIILLAGIVSGFTISVLIYNDIKNKERIKKKNKEIEINSHLLKKTQVLLLESEERYRNLFESSPLPLVIIGIDGTINSCNTQTCDQFGYNKNEVTGKHFSQFVADEDREKSLRLIEEVFSTGKTNDSIVKCTKKNNENFTTKISASVLRDKNTKPVGVICIISSI